MKISGEYLRKRIKIKKNEPVFLKRCNMSTVSKKKFICIRCPRGCEIITTIDGYNIDRIEGNICKMGVEYVENEIKDLGEKIIESSEAVTTTVKVKNGNFPLVPVWTNQPIPKDKIFILMKELRKVELKAPVDQNMVVLKNVFGTGIDVVTSGRVKIKKPEAGK